MPVLWPPNHRLVPVSIVGIIDPSESTKITITGVIQDETTRDSGHGRDARKHDRDNRDADEHSDKRDDDNDGGKEAAGKDHSQDDNDADEVDAIINPDGTVLLRAERAGNGDGRVYEISFTATNVEGSVNGIVKVIVPHSRMSMKVKDSGCKYNSDGEGKSLGSKKADTTAKRK